MLRPLLEEQDDSEQTAIREEPKFVEGTDEIKLKYSEKEKMKIKWNRYADKKELIT